MWPLVLSRFKTTITSRPIRVQSGPHVLSRHSHVEIVPYMGILPGLFSDHELMNWKNSFFLMSRLSSTSSSSIPCLLEILIQEDHDVRGTVNKPSHKNPILGSCGSKSLPLSKVSQVGIPCTLSQQMHQRSSIPEYERGGEKAKRQNQKGGRCRHMKERTPREGYYVN
jgi:hypothetical protein